MSKLYIPACGDRITLVEPWHINLYLEHRNIKYAQLVGLVPNTQNWSVYVPNTNYQLATAPHIIEPGTVLECDRVYIRGTSKSAASSEDSYDSVTWKIVVNGKAPRNQRFWVKLTDCATLEYDPASISRYLDRK